MEVEIGGGGGGGCEIEKLGLKRERAKIGDLLGEVEIDSVWWL